MSAFGFPLAGEDAFGGGMVACAKNKEPGTAGLFEIVTSYPQRRRLTLPLYVPPSFSPSFISTIHT